jgi:hypothetical protein
VRVIVYSGCGEDITHFCGENSGDMFHRAFNIQSAIAAVDIIDVDNDLRFAFELLLFHLLDFKFQISQFGVFVTL